MTQVILSDSIHTDAKALDSESHVTDPSTDPIGGLEQAITKSGSKPVVYTALKVRRSIRAIWIKVGGSGLRCRWVKDADSD
jgi:hypothetical protein